ncbi:hypothetical protein Dimus_020636, partial [Dionaea muscipula]
LHCSLDARPPSTAHPSHGCSLAGVTARRGVLLAEELPLRVGEMLAEEFHQSSLSCPPKPLAAPPLLLARPHAGRWPHGLNAREEPWPQADLRCPREGSLLTPPQLAATIRCSRGWVGEYRRLRCSPPRWSQGGAAARHTHWPRMTVFAIVRACLLLHVRQSCMSTHP